MYVYYDRAGNLKEIINDPVRSGDLYSKDILVYWDNHPSINTFNAKVRTSDGVVTNVEWISSMEVQLTIPYNQDRDLKFFKYNTPYKFFKYTPANTFPSGQTEVAFYFQYGGSWDQDHRELSDYRVVVLQILPFYVEETNDLSLGDNINQTQWSCLLNSLKMNNVRAYEDVPTSVELDNLGANSLIFNYGDNCVYKVILDPTYTPTDTDIEVDPYVLQLVAIMTPISSEYPISADLVDDTDSEHKFVTAQDLDMIGKIPENILTGTTQFFPVLMADTTTSNTNTNHNGGAYRTNLVYINSANGYVYAPKFYQNGNEVQDKLVSGTNIKTINGASVLGSGNLTVTASASWGSIIGTLSNQTDLQNALNGKLESTDLKTINSTSVLGSGNISVQPVIDSEHLLGADLVDDTTSTNKFVSASDITNWNGKQNALTFDSTPTQYSTNPVTSGGVYSAINSAISGVYKYKGSMTVAQINALNVSTLDSGFVYNVLDNGTITTGLSNLPVVSGDNVAWDMDSTSFEQLTGIVDLSGYQPLIDSTHKLSADLVQDGTTNKVVTATDITTWNGKLDSGDLKTINSASIVGSGNIDTKELYFCIHGTTTFAEVTTALSNNKLPICIYNDNRYYIYCSSSSTVHRFSSMQSDYVRYITVNDSNTWSSVSAYNLEIVANRTQSISNSSTTTQYPSAKCVYDYAQPILVSGTNIKTLNNNSLLGSGNIDISVPDYDTDANILSLVDELFTEYSISVSVTNGTYSGANSIKAYNGTATINVSANAGYTLPDSITVSGASYTYNDGTITLSEPTGNVSISVVCEAETPSGYEVTVTVQNTGSAQYWQYTRIYDNENGNLIGSISSANGSTLVTTDTGHIYIVIDDEDGEIGTGSVSSTGGVTVGNYGAGSYGYVNATVTGDGTITLSGWEMNF